MWPCRLQSAQNAIRVQSISHVSRKTKKKRLFCCRVHCCIIGCANQAKHKAGIPFCSTYAWIEQQGARIAFTQKAFWLFSKISLTFRRQNIYRRRETRSIYSSSHFRPVGKILLYANSILRQLYAPVKILAEVSDGYWRVRATRYYFDRWVKVYVISVHGRLNH